MSASYFPHPRPDELLFGLLGRHRRALGWPAAAAHIAGLFGARTVVASPDLQGRLGILAARLDINGLDADALLQDHTLFPYYTAFQRETLVGPARDDLIGNCASNAFVRLGLAAFAMGNRDLRVCPVCHAADIKNHGDVTWYRSHQLPGSLVCHRHEIPLVVVNLAARRERHAFSPPALEAFKIVPQAWSPDVRDLLCEIARRQASLLSAVGTSPGDLSCAIRKRLIEAGMMRSSRKVDQVRLHQAVCDVLGPALRLLPPPCSRFGDTGWVAAIVRSHRKSLHPLYHVLMAIVLDAVGVSTERRVLAASSSRHRIRKVKSSSPAWRAPRREWTTLDAEAIVRLRHARRVLLAEAPPRQVTFALLERRALGTGWIAKRTNKLPKAWAAARFLAEDDASFLDRRLAYWSERLGDVPAWSLFRAAGIRDGRWHEARSALHRIVDQRRRSA